MITRATALCLATGVVISTVSLAASEYAPLVGTWKGAITTNIRDTKVTAHVTTSDLGKPVEIVLRAEGPKVAGTSESGEMRETMTFEGDRFCFSDGTFTICTMRTPHSKVPAWVRDRIGNSPARTLFAFQFERCTVNATGQPCRAGHEIPYGLENAIWVWLLKGKTLGCNVYYTYPSGGRRILEQELTR